MPDTISIINQTTIKKSLGKALLVGVSLGVAASIVYGAYEVIGSFKYTNNLSAVEQLISNNDFDAVNKLLERYEKGSVLKDRDIIKLEGKLKEQKGKKRLDSLDYLISATEYEEAQALYSKFREEDILSAEESKLYKDMIHGISLEGLLQRIDSAVGKDQIYLIDKLSEQHPSYPEMVGLRKKQLDAYLLVAESYFITNESHPKVSDFFESFGNWVRIQHPRVFLGYDFSDFFNSAKSYLVMQASSPQTFKRGDEVIFRRNLGLLNGKGLNEYFVGTATTDQVPLNSKGIILEIDLDKDHFIVYHAKSDTKKNIISKEIELNREPLAKFYQQVKSIESYIKNLR